MANLADNFVSRITGENKFWTHWQWYKSIFSEATFKFFVSFISLLPAIAKIFQSPQQGNSMTVIETQLQTLFNWRLLWGAAILYLIAYGLYLLFCPKFIKTYNNFKDYKSYEHSPRWLVWLAQGIFNDKNELPKFVSRLEIKNYITKTTQATTAQIDKQNESNVDVLDKQTVLSFTYNNNYYQFGLPILTNNSFDKDATGVAEQEIFWELFGRYSARKKYVRLIISVFLFISSILFAIVILQYMCSMIKYIF